MKTAEISYNKELEEITIKLCGRQIWNEAIEACLNEVRTSWNTADYAEKIKKLKK